MGQAEFISMAIILKDSNAEHLKHDLLSWLFDAYEDGTIDTDSVSDLMKSLAYTNTQ